MSDGPTKVAPPEAVPLDDIILGEDDRTVPAAPPVPPKRPTAPPLPSSPSNRPPSDPSLDRTVRNLDRGSGPPPALPSEPPKDPSKDTRKRQKLTLRIPDDEVSRPQLPATTPMGGVPAVSPSRPPSRPDYQTPPVRETPKLPAPERRPLAE